MHTFALQLAFFAQSTDPDDARIDAFIGDVKEVAERRGITLCDSQSIRLLSRDFQLRPCDRCGALTVNASDLDSSVEKMLPDFWFSVRRGKVDESSSLCYLCT